MLGDFIYAQEMEDTSNKTEMPQKLEKAAKRFLLLAAIIIGGGLIWLLLISPCMMPVKMHIETFPGMSKTDVLNITGIPGGATYISINPETAEHLLSRHYLIESAKVTKRFPDRLSIFLVPRKAVALTLINVNNRSLPVFFDRNGVVIKIGLNAGEVIPEGLPVISGVLNENISIKPGLKVSMDYLPVFSRIGIISDEDPNIWRAISEIGISKKSNEKFDLILYPANNPIKLRLGSDLNKEKIYYALVMSVVGSQLGTNIPNEIDVRSGLGVVKREDLYGN